MRVVQPYTASPYTDGGNKRSATRVKGDALFLCRRGSHLLDLAIGKPLAPNVKTMTRIRGEVHPFPIRRPSCGRANPIRGSDERAARAAVEGNKAAAVPEI